MLMTAAPAPEAVKHMVENGEGKGRCTRVGTGEWNLKE